MARPLWADAGVVRGQWSVTEVGTANGPTYDCRMNTSFIPAAPFTAAQPLPRATNDRLGFVPHDPKVDGRSTEVLSAFPERYDFGDSKESHRVAYRLGSDATAADAIREAKRVAGSGESLSAPGLANVYQRDGRFWVSPADGAVWSDHGKPTDHTPKSLYTKRGGDPVASVGRTSSDLVAVVSGDAMADFRDRGPLDPAWKVWGTHTDFVSTRRYDGGAPATQPIARSATLATAVLPFTDSAYLSSTLLVGAESVRLGTTSFDDAVTSARLLAAQLPYQPYAIVRDAADGARWIVSTSSRRNEIAPEDPDFGVPTPVTIPRVPGSDTPPPVNNQYDKVVGITSSTPGVEAIVGADGLIDLRHA